MGAVRAGAERRRRVEIQFEESRLSAGCLVAAYEQLVPRRSRAPTRQGREPDRRQTRPSPAGREA
jgi:hypothetical protein